MEGPLDFDKWLLDISPESFTGGAQIDEPWLRWLRNVYLREGRLTRDELEERALRVAEEVVSSAPWSRIVDDFAATTRRDLALRVHPPRAEDRTWLEFEVAVDGRWIGAFGRSIVSPSADALVAELADLLREFALDEEVWGGWPTCPDHGTHPLDPDLDDGGRAVWRCPAGRIVAPIGALPGGA